MLTDPEQKIYFKSLDTLRFFAFIVVFNQHSFKYAFNIEDYHSFPIMLVRFLCNGPLGVSFFFVLSGFLITYLLLREKMSSGKINLPYFYMRRALRIWPLYFAVVLFSLYVFPVLARQLSMEQVEYAYNKFMHLVFLSNFDVIYLKHIPDAISYVMVEITWSVSIEEQFYLIWPILFIFIPVNYYRFIFPSVLLLSLVFRLINQEDLVVQHFHSLSAANDLATGGYAAYLCCYEKSFIPFIRSIKRIVIILIYLAGFTLLLFHDNLAGFHLIFALIRIPEALFFVFIILEQNFSENSFKKFGDWKQLSGLGTITYGLYLMHPVCIRFTEFAVNSYAISMSELYRRILSGLLALVFSIMLCKISYRYFESYFLRLKDKFSIIHSRR